MKNIYNRLGTDSCRDFSEKKKKNIDLIYNVQSHLNEIISVNASYENHASTYDVENKLG